MADRSRVGRTRGEARGSGRDGDGHVLKRIGGCGAIFVVVVIVVVEHTGHEAASKTARDSSHDSKGPRLTDTPRGRESGSKFELSAYYSVLCCRKFRRSTPATQKGHVAMASIVAVTDQAAPAPAVSTHPPRSPKPAYHLSPSLHPALQTAGPFDPFSLAEPAASSSPSATGPAPVAAAPLPVIKSPAVLVAGGNSPALLIAATPPATFAAALQLGLPPSASHPHPATRLAPHVMAAGAAAVAAGAAAAATASASAPAAKLNRAPPPLFHAAPKQRSPALASSSPLISALMTHIRQSPTHSPSVAPLLGDAVEQALRPLDAGPPSPHRTSVPSLASPQSVFANIRKPQPHAPAIAAAPLATAAAGVTATAQADADRLAAHLIAAEAAAEAAALEHNPLAGLLTGAPKRSSSEQYPHAGGAAKKPKASNSSPAGS